MILLGLLWIPCAFLAGGSCFIMSKSAKLAQIVRIATQKCSNSAYSWESSGQTACFGLQAERCVL